MGKNMQKWMSKFRVGLGIMLIFYSLSAIGNQQLLIKADSLYAQKKFAEASKVYEQLYQQGLYSSATLLKMAFVYEGLGKTGKALYYLSAYYRLTEDSKVYEKIQTLANAKGVSGFELSEMDRLSIWAVNRKEIYLPILISMAVFLTVLMLYYTKRKQQNGKFVAGFFSILTLLILFVSVNFIEAPHKAVITTGSYFMSGPSAAANLIQLIPEGNQVKLGRERDIWIEAEWNDETGYLRKTDLLLTR
jgi:hypothetical protein